MEELRYTRFENGNDDSTGMTLGHHMIESGKDFDNDGRIRNKKVAVYRPSDGGFHIGTITKFLENSSTNIVSSTTTERQRNCIYS